MESSSGSDVSGGTTQLSETTSDSAPEPSVRVMVWVAPHSMSTAFSRAIASNARVKMLFELYTYANYVGEDRLASRYAGLPTVEGCSFHGAKATYESSHPGYDAVFGKEAAHNLTGKLSDCSWLPKGYIHTFLIRHPEKTLTSLYKFQTDSSQPGLCEVNSFDPSDAGFSELLTVFRLVTEQLGQEALVLDADDLLAAPERYLREYCARTGLQYVPEMLQWGESRAAPLSILPIWGSWYQEALTSSGFHAPSADETQARDRPVKLQQAIDANLEPYRELYRHRMCLENV